MELRKQMIDANPEDIESRIRLVAACAGFGSICHKQGRDDDAMTLVDQASHAWLEPLPFDSSSEIALSRLGEQLGRLRQLCRDLGDTENCRAAGHIAVQAMEVAHQKAPDSKRARVGLATAYHKLADVYRSSGDENDLPKAEPLYLQAIRLRDPLVKENPTDEPQRTELTWSYINLGKTLRETGRLEEAQAAILDAVGLWTTGSGELPRSEWAAKTFGEATMELFDLTPVTSEDLEEKSVYANTIATWEKIFEEHPKEIAYRIAFSNECAGLAEKHRAEISPEKARQLAEMSQIAWHNLPPLDDVSAIERLAPSQRYLGWQLMHLGRTREAEEMIRLSLESAERALTKTPSSVDCLASRAWSMQELGNVLKAEKPVDSLKALREAMRQWEEVLKKSPDDSRYREQYGNTLRRLCAIGSWNEADEAYQKAIELAEHLATTQPDRLDMQWELARLSGDYSGFLVEAGRGEEAVGTFRQAMEIMNSATVELMQDPKNRAAYGSAWLQLQSRFDHFGQDEVAEQALTKLIQIGEGFLAESPQAVTNREFYGHVLSRLANARTSTGQDKEAIDLWRKILPIWEALAKECPDKVQYRNCGTGASAKLVDKLYRIGEIEDALEVVVRALEVNPDNSGLALVQIEILLWAERMDDYRSAIAAMIDLFGESARTVDLILLAKACALDASMANDPAIALKLARRATTDDPESAWMANILGLALYRADQFEEAQRCFHESLQAAPDEDLYALNWLGLALVHCQKGEPQRAEEYFLKAVEWSESNGHANLGGQLQNELMRREVKAFLDADKASDAKMPDEPTDGAKGTAKQSTQDAPAQD